MSDLQMVFVCGCGHSGTSLMLAMLDAHPDIHGIAMETAAFRQKWKPEQIVAYFRDTHAPAAREKGARILCEKTPKHIKHLKQIRAVFPDARIVVMVRDARDVVHSLTKRGLALDRAIWRWNEEDEIALAERDNAAPDTVVIRYEDLIADPAATLTRICAHIGVTFVPAMLDFHASERRWFEEAARPEDDDATRIQHRSLRDWQLHQPLMDRRGVWRDELPPETVQRIETECAPLMRAFGYLPSAEGNA